MSAHPDDPPRPADSDALRAAEAAMRDVAESAHASPVELAPRLAAAQSALAALLADGGREGTAGSRRRPVDSTDDASAGAPSESADSR